MDLWTVNLGAYNLSKSESSVQNMTIKRIIEHPHFGQGKDGPFSNDIALIELNMSVILNKRVAVGCLPAKNIYPAVGKQCIIAGKILLVKKPDQLNMSSYRLTSLHFPFVLNVLFPRYILNTLVNL